MPSKATSKSSKTIAARSTIRYRVIAGLSIILLAFAGLTTYSILLHSRTVSSIRLINTSYLPLSHGMAELSATQVLFNTQMDRLADDPGESVTLKWIDTWRKARPSTLERLSKTALAALQKYNIAKEEAAFLGEISKRLLDVRNRYDENESEFQRLYFTMDVGQVDDARKNIEGMKRVERNLNKILRAINDEVDLHITELGEQAEKDGNRATWILTLLTLVTVMAAGAVIVSINNLLKPLKTLQGAVARVATGDLKTRINVTGHDEIGALATGFNRMTEALADRDQMLIRSERLATTGKMAAQVTHEIRNPLSSLGLNAELLEEELDEGMIKGEAGNLLAAMQDEIERLTGITESYLRFARLPSPELTFNDVNETTQSVLEFMKSEISNCGISVKTNFGENLDSALFDDGQIRQALTNLIRNACEAMPTGGVLSVSTSKTSNLIRLEISDTGTGVPEDDVEHIFESFYSTKSSGTGLGLPLVRQICLAHSGDIEYENNAETGSTFAITLPGTKNDDDKEVN